MTLIEAMERVKAIQSASGDDEIAHGMEDTLYTDFIRYIASTNGEHAEIARELLKTEEIDFARWCA